MGNLKNCKTCGIGANKVILHRCNPIGETPAQWQCTKCIEVKPDPKRLEFLNTLMDCLKESAVKNNPQLE